VLRRHFKEIEEKTSYFDLKKKEAISCKYPPPPRKVLLHDKHNLYSAFVRLGLRSISCHTSSFEAGWFTGAASVFSEARGKSCGLKMFLSQGRGLSPGSH
jgi:hypothetical protein